MKKYRRGINDLCKVEQDLATGLDKDGEVISDPVKIMMPKLFDRTISVQEKLRLLCLYFVHKGGMW